MNTVCRDIFRAIHEGKWLSIEYRNGQDEVTKYWIGIMNIDTSDRSMKVQGLHLARLTTLELKIYIDSILSSSVLDGSYFDINEKLIEDIRISRRLRQERIRQGHSASSRTARRRRRHFSLRLIMRWITSLIPTADALCSMK